MNLTLISLSAISNAAPVHPTLPFDNLVLVDEIDCGDINDPHPFEEFPSGVSEIQTISGVATRVIPNPVGSEARYFAYRIGANKGLQAGKAYVLQVEYPEDVSRTMYIINTGGSMSRGLHTGKTVGDALDAPYVGTNPESLNMPMSGQFETWQNLFHLHDRFSDVVRPRSGGAHPDLPADGFKVIIAQYANREAPLSNGAAVSKIRLYEAPDESTYTAQLNLPSNDLPRRHIFYREEMADGVIWSKDPTQRGVADSTDWFEYKAKRMKFLGMNTYTTDLLEFGSNQGFDSGPGGGNEWYFVAREPERWGNVLDMLTNYDFDVLPYYEYSGSKGGADDSLGPQKRATPLNGSTIYTHISWAESSRADITDSDTIADAKLLLDATISRYKDQVNFIGAWFRARVSQMPMSFNEKNFTDYANERNGGIPITRQQLRDSEARYEDYKSWWFEKRRDFINEIRDHLREQGVNSDANILYTSDATETGKSDLPPGQYDLVAEDVTAWNTAGYSATSLQDALDVDRHFRGLTVPRDTYGGYEWQHADVENDPHNYTANEGGMLTYSFNRAYTVSDGDALEAFKTPSGTAVVRHFCLNEDAMTIDLNGPNEIDPLGYFVSDCEYTGPYVMFEEALAFANGDPRYVGYLSSWRFNPGFPAYVRAFNQAFLALPALPSTVLATASSDPAVVVRSIETEGYGTYLGVVNTARNDVSVTITLPDRGLLVDAATGDVISNSTDSISIEMYPSQLRAFRLDKQTLDGAVAFDDSASLDEGTSVDVDVRANDTGPGTLSIVSIGEASNGTATIVGDNVRYVPDSGFYGQDSVAYTVTNGTDDDIARIYFTVNNTATANDLIGWGLDRNPIGNFVEGGSRVLADGVTAEMRGTGKGFAGERDSALFESQSILGNFTLTAQVSDFAALGNGSVGVMIRQGLRADSRFVSLGFNASGEHVYFSRKETGGVSTKGSTTTSGGWLRLVRTGTIIEMQVSADNVSYTTIGRRVLPGLPVKIEAGVFLTGGNVNNHVSGNLQNFSVTNQSLGSNVLFAQSFSDGSDLQTYFNPSPSQNQLSEAVAEADGGTWSIEDGVLQIERTGISTADSGAGFARLVDFAGPPSVMKFSFDYSVSNASTSGISVVVTHGDFDSVSDYSSGGVSAHKFGELAIKGKGVGLYHFSIGGSKYGDSLANGEPSTIVIYLNDSGQTQTYEGPDGNLHQIENLKSSYWLNGELLVANHTRPATYNATGLKTFRVKVQANDASTIGFDNIIIENTFPISQDPNTNLAPNAIDDSVAVNEGEPLLIAPVANDIDPDNGPDGLILNSFTAPSNGTVEQYGNELVYTPELGFFGQDSFDYTILDGEDSDTATVNITVNDTSLFSNLSSLGLTGINIGGSSGYSRLLSGGDLEVNSSGSGLGGTSDGVQLEQMTFSGNFSVQLRVANLIAMGAAPRGGIMIREDTEDNARTAMLTTSTDSEYRYAARTSIGSNLIEFNTGISYNYPGAWLRMIRFEDTIIYLVSEDGISFTEIDTTTINGLKETVHVGLFAAQARMIAADLEIVPAQEALFQQDFSQSTVVADYINTLLPERNLFTDISAESDGGTWSIDSGALKLIRTGINSESNGAGFYRLTDFENPPSIVKVSFNVSVENVTAYTNIAAFDLGNWSSHFDYNSGGASSDIANSLVIKGGGPGQFRFQIKGQNSDRFPDDGTPVSAVWYVNTSGASLTYTGPDALSHTLDDEASSLWVNGTLLLDNIQRSNAYAVNAIENFRFSMATHLPVTITLDNLKIENSFLVNDPPVAADDSAVTNERTTATINVLANDTDSDSQPAPLSIYSIGDAHHGSVSLLGSNITYTPDPGFYGVDEFTYLVTDGVEQDWGLVTVTVNSNTLSNTLTSEGLTGINIGSNSNGSSRVLQTTDWEVSGSGSGLSGTVDSFHFEEDTVDGDFSIVVRVTDLQSNGSAPRAGIMVRENNNADARMVALATTLATNYAIISRTTTGGSSSETIATESYTYPNGWLMLERVGDIINIAVSADGLSFIQIDSVTLTGLGTSVNVGLFSSSGSVNETTYATFDDFDLTISSAIFVQDFNSSSAVSSYFDITNPSANQFNDISAEVDGGTWSINNGALQIVRSGLGGSNAGSGFMRYTDFAGSPSVMKVEFDVSVNNIDTYTDLASFRLGDYSYQSDYSGTTASVSTTFELIIKGGGTNLFRFRINGMNTIKYPADGSFVHVVWYMNASGTTQTYIGPDGLSHTVDHLSNSLWCGTTLLIDNRVRFQNHLNTNLTDIYFRCPTTQSAVLQFDNLVISDTF
ncbi:Ig-like domain-containing protein [Rubellicoccus peritrichatus]|uniref:Ig-like domain-containing protein n=1 Tax=Rubellicoccus peritrichatus TaxID=3080537 RepID=A0AAQ3LBX6_9BACT|nr:Ig-like domain-containing protein [Puniceicoccus sp. CR14]WOO43274.1 Ig-like domain-containing protein [Puniceicoccus sp. CR14]